MAKAYGIVYYILNKINGKMYVGQTTHSLKKRLNEHPYCKSSAIGKAIRKYGWQKFRYGVLKNCDSKAELDKWEKFLIILLNTKGRKGYNQTDGGEGMSGYFFSDKTRAELSAKRKGVKKSPQHRMNISLSRRNITPYKNLLNEIENRQFKYLELAELLGLSSVNFSNKMNGRYNFTEKDIERLVVIFNFPAEYLMMRTDGLSATISKTESFAKISAVKRGYSPYKNLLNELDKRQLTYRGLSKLTGICKSSLPLKMRDKVKFTADEIAKLAEIFDKPIEYLMFKEESL